MSNKSKRKFINRTGSYLNTKNRVSANLQAEKILIFAILGLALLLRIVIAPIIKGYPADMGLFELWANSAANDLTGIYNIAGNISLDYPPVYIYVLFVIGKILNFFGSSLSADGIVVLIKLPAMLADVVTAFLLYKISGKFIKGYWKLAIAAIYVFNPAVLYNSTIYGQIDSILAMVIAVALYFLIKGDYIFSSMFFAIAILLKPQGIFVLPVLLFAILFRAKPLRKKLADILISLATGLATTILIILPFSFTQKPLWIMDLYLKTIDGYQYASLNAFNLFSLLGANWSKDDVKLSVFGVETPLSYLHWGYILAGLVLVFVLALYVIAFLRRLKNPLTPSIHFIASLILVTGIFMFSSRMHERYMFPAMVLALLAFVYLKDKIFLIIYTAFSFVIFTNVFAVLSGAIKAEPSFWILKDAPNDTWYNLMLIMSAINILIFLCLIITALYTVITGKGVLQSGNKQVDKNIKSEKPCITAR